MLRWVVVMGAVSTTGILETITARINSSQEDLHRTGLYELSHWTRELRGEQLDSVTVDKIMGRDRVSRPDKRKRESFFAIE